MSTPGGGRQCVGESMAVRSAYFDYQASAPMDPAVLEAMNRAYATPGNASAEEHSYGWNARDQVEAARRQVASLLNAEPDEVYFTSGATEANNIAIIGAALSAPASRKRVLISSIEHKSVTATAKSLERLGFSVELIHAAEDGVIDLEALAGRLTDDVAVISVMAVNNEIGTIQPITEVARMGRAVGAFVHTDATQALAAIPVDMQAWGCDSISLSGHKISGPGGVGALVVSTFAPWRPAPISFGGGQEGGLRPGTIPTPLCVGLGRACELLESHGEDERVRVAGLRDRLADQLRTANVHFKVTAASSPRHPGCLHLRFIGVDAVDLLTRLQPQLAASTGSACTSGIIGPSETLLAIGMSSEEASQCLRLSLGRFTTQVEVEAAATWIAEGIRAQRASSSFATG